MGGVDHAQHYDAADLLDVEESWSQLGWVVPQVRSRRLRKDVEEGVRDVYSNGIYNFSEIADKKD